MSIRPGLRFLSRALAVVPLAVVPLAALAAAAQTNVHDCSFCHVTHGAPGPTLTLASDVEVLCLTCHGPAGSAPLKAAVHENEDGGPYTFRMTCIDCHTPHSSMGNWLGGTNLEQVGTDADDSGFARISTPNSGIRDVVFESRGTDGGGASLHSFADNDEDGNGLFDGVCEACHTVSQHHTNSAPDTSHFTGSTCTLCHTHENGFLPTPHPSPVTDCSNCHLDPDTGKKDLLAPHGYDCSLCHPNGFDGTILGPLGTWQGECDECHNPSVPETGNMAVFTKGHRCIVCHGEQRPTTPYESIHQEHLRRANCVVCHGFIPDAGVTIGSGDRSVCYLCHTNPSLGAAQTTIHKVHVPKGGSCFECHSDTRPAVDTVDGPPVGSSTNVCQICHTDKDPSEFQSDMDGLHKKHTGKAIDCGACHAQAELQDDRDPMPPIDDPVRSQLPRGGYGACVHCHGGGQSGSSQTVHKRHVEGKWVWCYTCHDAADARPLGQAPPVTQPSEACVLCHSNRQYNDTFPYNIHKKHTDKKQVKCYSCHQLTPPLRDWPASWHAPGLH